MSNLPHNFISPTVCIDDMTLEEALSRNLRNKVVLSPREPAQVGLGMVGIIKEHPYHVPGTVVSTSKVLRVEGNLALTKTQIYVLT